MEGGSGVRGPLSGRVGLYGSVQMCRCEPPNLRSRSSIGYGSLIRRRGFSSILVSRRVLTCFLLVVTLTLAAAFLYSGAQTEEEKLSTSPLVLVPHDPIFIANDTALHEMALNEGWDGDGSLDAPYEIADYEIHANGYGVSGIEIHNTTNHIAVRNCTIHGDGNSDSGILLVNVTNATAFENFGYGFEYGVISLVESSECGVFRNTCTNQRSGVYLQDSDNNTIADNNCSYSSYGISLVGSSWNLLSNNSCSYCDQDGIYLRVFFVEIPSSDNTIVDNNCSYCGNNGIDLLEGCSNNKIDGNICNDNRVGMWIHGSPSTVISNNTCSGNEYDGVLLIESSYCVICDNVFSDNGQVYAGYGVDVRGCYYNRIFNNTFIDNNGAGDTYDSSHIQALDEGGLNQWNASGYGNYWSDWLGPDDNSDGIVDLPYNISSLPLAKDYFPRTTQPLPIPEFSHPFVPVFMVVLIAITIMARKKRSQEI